ncbi:hypothetical protein Q3A80_20280, partial [Burkholderia sp. SR8]|uniref:hypothetical protein n=1 Tax=Burkholderia sp. SR8 TaxID=3062277 RepID=UPI0040645BAC
MVRTIGFRMLLSVLRLQGPLFGMDWQGAACVVERVSRIGWNTSHAPSHRDGAQRRRSVKAGGGILQEREMHARGG